MVQQRVQQGRSDAQRHGPRRQLGPLLCALGLRHPPDELVKPLHAGVQEGYIVGVQHLAQRAGTPEVHGDIRGGVERVRLGRKVAYGFAPLLRGLRLLHDAHKLRQTRGLLRGHVQRLHTRHHLAHPSLRLLDGAGGVVEHGGVDAAQRLVELPVFPVVLYLCQRPRIVPCKRRSVPRVEPRGLQVADHVPGKECWVVSCYQRLEQVVGAASHARQLIALRRVRRQRFHGVEQRVVHRHFPQLSIHIGRDDLVLAGPLDGGIVQCLRVELMLILARLLDVAVYRVRVACAEIVAQQPVREAVFTALTHDLHCLFAQRFMQRHQAFRAALCAAHCLADTHRVQIPAPARGVLVLHAHGGHIVGIELLEEVRVLLCHKPAVHPVLHHVVDVLPYLCLVLRELRVLRQQLLGAGPAVLCRKFIVEHRLVLDGLGLVQIPQQPLPLTCQRRDVRIRILRQPVELGGGVRPNIRVLGVEVAQRRFRLQHLFRLALGQAHAVDVVQVEHVELEVVIEVLPSCADGREHIVEAVPHLPAPHVRLGIRDHVHARRGRRPCLVVELIQVRIADRLRQLRDAVPGIHHFPVEEVPRFAGSLSLALLFRCCLVRDHVRGRVLQVLPAADHVRLVGIQAGQLVEVGLQDLLLFCCRRCFALLQPSELRVIHGIRRRVRIICEDVLILRQRVHIGIHLRPVCRGDRLLCHLCRCVAAALVVVHILPRHGICWRRLRGIPPDDIAVPHKCARCTLPYHRHLHLVDSSLRLCYTANRRLDVSYMVARFCRGRVGGGIDAFCFFVEHVPLRVQCLVQVIAVCAVFCHDGRYIGPFSVIGHGRGKYIAVVPPPLPIRCVVDLHTVFYYAGNGGCQLYLRLA